MQNLYRSIVETITQNEQRFTELGLAPLRTIDIYNGQPDAPQLYEFLSPALFVDYEIDWERGGSGQKRGVISIDIHILTDPRPGTENWSERSEEGAKRLLYYSLIGELLETVRGDSISGDSISSLYLIGEKPNKTDYFDYHILTFEASIIRHKERLLPLKNIKLQINAKSTKI